MLEEYNQNDNENENFLSRFIGTAIGRILISLLVPIITFIVLWRGFIFLRDSNAPKAIMMIIAILWGVGGVLALYVISNWLVQNLPMKWRQRLSPYIFVGPALIIMSCYLILPTLLTLIISLFKTQGGNTYGKFVFLQNYITAILSQDFKIAFVNNIIWIIFGPGLAVFFGLVIALLADRSNFEVPAKALIFLPMAISFIGAGIIWRFVYAYKPAGEAQIGLLNQMLTLFGLNPENWLIFSPEVSFFGLFKIKLRINSILLTLILVWMYTGYAMVLISSAIKGVPEDLLEAARIDGAGEFRIILSVIIPYIKGTIITVATTIIIVTLKIFDIVYSMTGGNYDTDVLATLQFHQMFGVKNYNLGSTYAIILLVAVIPFVLYNLRQFREREAF